MLSGTARGNEDEEWERPLEGEYREYNRGMGPAAQSLYRTFMKDYGSQGGG